MHMPGFVCVNVCVTNDQYFDPSFSNGGQGVEPKGVNSRYPIEFPTHKPRACSDSCILTLCGIVETEAED